MGQDLMRRRLIALAAIGLLAVGGCAGHSSAVHSGGSAMGTKAGSATGSKPAAGSKSAARPAATSAGAGSGVAAPIRNVTIDGAVLTVQGRNGSLAGVVRNASGTTYRVTAITCACAATIRMGQPAKSRQLVPIKGGLPLPAGGTIKFGTNSLAVQLTNLLPTAGKGLQVPVIVYLGDSGAVTGTAHVS